MPSYTIEGSAGMVLRACIEQRITLQTEEANLIATGIAFYLNSAAYSAFILPRSELGHKNGIVLGNWSA